LEYITFYRPLPLKTYPLVGWDERGSLPKGDQYVYKQLDSGDITEEDIEISKQAAGAWADLLGLISE
jgi:hypothetical protein